MVERPNIEDIHVGAELKKWYWLKEELVAHCKHKGIPYGGSKFEILERIAERLDSGIVKAVSAKSRATSCYDWHSEHLTLETVITDNYKNSQNVRQFFQQHCGSQFHFSIAFMDWMKSNVGKTLADAVEEWKRLNERRKDKTLKVEIPKGNQYNQYIRDFFADNPDKTIADARRCWRLKRALPLGLHRYERADLKLQEK